MAQIRISGERAGAAAALDRIAAEHHLPARILADMQVALDEILANIAEYAYTDKASREIRIRFEVAGDCLEAVIEDNGAPFDPLTVPPPDLAGPVRERRVGGLGIHLVRNLMDEVRYERVGRRNRLVVRKRLKT